MWFPVAVWWGFTNCYTPVLLLLLCIHTSTDEHDPNSPPADQLLPPHSIHSICLAYAKLLHVFTNLRWTKSNEAKPDLCTFYAIWPGNGPIIQFPGLHRAVSNKIKAAMWTKSQIHLHKHIQIYSWFLSRVSTLEHSKVNFWAWHNIVIFTYWFTFLAQLKDHTVCSRTHNEEICSDQISYLS